MVSLADVLLFGPPILVLPAAGAGAALGAVNVPLTTEQRLGNEFMSLPWPVSENALLRPQGRDRKAETASAEYTCSYGGATAYDPQSPRRRVVSRSCAASLFVTFSSADVFTLPALRAPRSALKRAPHSNALRTQTRIALKRAPHSNLQRAPH